MIRRPPRSTLSSSSAASDVYKRQPFLALLISHAFCWWIWTYMPCPFRRCAPGAALGRPCTVGEAWLLNLNPDERSLTCWHMKFARIQTWERDGLVGYGGLGTNRSSHPNNERDKKLCL
eukprot:TRINITY_DN37689_c0_g1_i1.p3 TRINITY_DN37689_c0_g1~~TRINITY_DN37689_c0_g1_i1.p3  ORF type:complete len:119 (+),score=12.20 TRINITY_DN37689_c0_g1_i1:125-481(+)